MRAMSGPREALALLCSYDGAAFRGFQRQPPFPTVQGALEDAFRALGHKVRIEGCGRTDAGVHAERYVATVRGRELPDPAGLAERLAAVLPAGLVIGGAADVPMRFHARFSAVGKVYRYRVCTDPDAPEVRAARAWLLPDLRGFPMHPGPISIDAARARDALQCFTGRRDFSSVVHPGGEGKRVRLLPRAELHEERPGLYALTLAAPGFLRHQVRNLVGVAIAHGLGAIDRGTVERLARAEGDRWRGARAPGHGLALADVIYRAGEDPFRGAHVDAEAFAAAGEADE